MNTKKFRLQNMLENSEQFGEDEIDDMMVAIVTEEMSNKLAKKREEGRGGWYGCSEEFLYELLQRHVEKGDMIDVLNLAAMIHARRLIFSN